MKIPPQSYRKTSKRRNKFSNKRKVQEIKRNGTIITRSFKCYKNVQVGEIFVWFAAVWCKMV